MPGRRRIAGRPLFALVLSGCGAGWRSLPPLAPSALPPDQQVQVWSQGKARQWHGVLVTADSVSGVPFLRPLPCDSCRLALPRAQVDSLRVGSPSNGFWKSAGLLAVGIGVLAVLTGWYVPAD
ncbi:MAG: hypothetical protein ABJC36_00635 [Gemmatimonadales bacterium]